MTASDTVVYTDDNGIAVTQAELDEIARRAAAYHVRKMFNN